MNREELKGRVERTRGQAKQVLGDVTDDERMRDEGEIEEAAGETREGLGRARRKTGEAIEEIGEKLKK